ncbi:uncharacterized protein LOC144339055 isoform X2 [Macaca mulatta]
MAATGIATSDLVLICELPAFCLALGAWLGLQLWPSMSAASSEVLMGSVSGCEPQEACQPCQTRRSRNQRFHSLALEFEICDAVALHTFPVAAITHIKFQNERRVYRPVPRSQREEIRITKTESCFVIQAGV